MAKFERDSLVEVEEKDIDPKTGLYTVPPFTKKIEVMACHNRKNLTKLIFGDSVTEIGPSAFQHCPNLAHILFPKTLKTIHSEAFAECPGIVHVFIPDGVTYMDNGIFDDCINLAGVTLPGTLNYLPDMPICNGCCNLKSLTLLGKMSVIKSSTFEGCKLSVIKINPYSNDETRDEEWFEQVKAALPEELRPIVFSIECFKQISQVQKNAERFFLSQPNLTNYAVAFNAPKVGSVNFTLNALNMTIRTRLCEIIQSVELPADIDGVEAYEARLNKKLFRLTRLYKAAAELEKYAVYLTRMIAKSKQSKHSVKPHQSGEYTPQQHKEVWRDELHVTWIKELVVCLRSKEFVTFSSTENADYIYQGKCGEILRKYHIFPARKQVKKSSQAAVTPSEAIPRPPAPLSAAATSSPP